MIVDGRVGQTLWVRKPTYVCSGGSGYSLSVVEGYWTWGLDLDLERSTDTNFYFGTPNQGGMYTVRMRIHNVRCDGREFDGFEQELIFRILS